jgi:hypothetical protein
MGLAEIADGIEITEQQDERCVATVDDTDSTLAQRLAPFEVELPCSAEEAGTVLDRYAGGGSIGDAGRVAGVAPITAAKTLYLLGESVSPATPLQRGILTDWQQGDLSRTEALELTGLNETEFALSAYVETHEPLEAACAEIEGLLAAQSLVEDGLADAVGGGLD